MRILITNDDGIHAAGIKTLEKAVSKFSDDIWVIAPETPQSAVGHSISFLNPLVCVKHDERHIGVKGTPADSVIFALNGILKDNPPDIVLSGINKGANLCSDITCSGTICACIEAVNHGAKAIAFSQSGFVDTKWKTAEHFIEKMFLKLVDFDLPKGEFLSVNFPNAEISAVKGIKVAKQSFSKGRVLEESRYHFEFEYNWIGELISDDGCTDGYDSYLIKNNFVTVTPFKVNLTSEDTMKELEKIKW